jgi:hypothetical protein
MNKGVLVDKLDKFRESSSYSKNVSATSDALLGPSRAFRLGFEATLDCGQMKVEELSDEISSNIYIYIYILFFYGRKEMKK